MQAASHVCETSAPDVPSGAAKESRNDNCQLNSGSAPGQLGFELLTSAAENCSETARDDRGCDSVPAVHELHGQARTTPHLHRRRSGSEHKVERSHDVNQTLSDVPPQLLELANVSRLRIFLGRDLPVKSHLQITTGRVTCQ